MDALDADQRTSLRVLGFLYLRLGYCERAARLFRALTALDPGDVDAAKSLAAAQIESGKAEAALELLAASPLREAADDDVLMLLKARALWRLERNAEARAAMNAWLAARAGVAA